MTNKTESACDIVNAINVEYMTNEIIKKIKTHDLQSLFEINGFDAVSKVPGNPTTVCVRYRDPRTALEYKLSLQATFEPITK